MNALLILALLLPIQAFAQAHLNFPRWEKVAPSDVLKPVAELVYEVVKLGSVGPKQKSNPLPQSCAVYENEALVGYSLRCLGDR